MQACVLLTISDHVQMRFPGFPWITSTRLYPEYGLSANPNTVPLSIQEAIVTALYG